MSWLNPFAPSSLPVPGSTPCLSDKCSVYWDYENMPIPKKHAISEVVTTLKERLWTSIGFRIPIEFKVYIRASKVTQRIQDDFDINGITQIQVPSTKPESVDKRMMIDITFSLYELERDQKSRSIALISGDKDFGYLLSKIRDTPPITKSHLILLRPMDIDHNLSNVVDEVIQLDFKNNHQNDKIKSSPVTAPKREKKITLHFQCKDDSNSNEIWKFKTRPTNLVLNVRQSLYRKFKEMGIPQNRFLIFNQGIKLEDGGGTIASYGITDGHSLSWSIAPDRESKEITLNLKHCDSKKSGSDSSEAIMCSIDIQSSNTIYALRRALYLEYLDEGAICNQFLIYHGITELKKDDDTISSHNILDGDTLTWNIEQVPVPRNRKLCIHCWHSTDKSIPMMRVYRKASGVIRTLQTAIGEAHGIDSNTILLKFKGKLLSSSKSFKRCGISFDCCIIWDVMEGKKSNDQMKDDVNISIADPVHLNCGNEIADSEADSSCIVL